MEINMQAKMIGIRATQVLFFLFMLDQARNWITWTFYPESAMALFQVSAETVWGINMLKTDMTSGVAAAGVCALLYFVRGAQWLPPAIVIVSVFLVTRGISLIVDGTTAMLWYGMLYEGAYFAAAYILWRHHQSEA